MRKIYLFPRRIMSVVLSPQRLCYLQLHAFMRSLNLIEVEQLSLERPILQAGIVNDWEAFGHYLDCLPTASTLFTRVAFAVPHEQVITENISLSNRWQRYFQKKKQPQLSKRLQTCQVALQSNPNADPPHDIAYGLDAHYLQRLLAHFKQHALPIFLLTTDVLAYVTLLKHAFSVKKHEIIAGLFETADHYCLIAFVDYQILHWERIMKKDQMPAQDVLHMLPVTPNKIFLCSAQTVQRNATNLYTWQSFVNNFFPEQNLAFNYALNLSLALSAA